MFHGKSLKCPTLGQKTALSKLLFWFNSFFCGPVWLQLGFRGRQKTVFLSVLIIANFTPRSFEILNFFSTSDNHETGNIGKSSDEERSNWFENFTEAVSWSFWWFQFFLFLFFLRLFNISTELAEKSGYPIRNRQLLVVFEPWRIIECNSGRGFRLIANPNIGRTLEHVETVGLTW